MKYFNQDVSFNFKKKRIVSLWVKSTIENETLVLGSINVIFTSDTGLLKINQEFLKHDYYTDIITFDYTENNIVSGELYISIDRVKENSKDLSIEFVNELHRVIIHGALHLCGYKDKSEIDELLMRQKEDFYLNKLVLE